MTFTQLPTPAQQAERLPASPGVYLMKDRDGQLLYVGKAINLRSRVKSYFLSDHEDRRLIPFMLERLHAIDWIATNTEAEALILEANLVRIHKPPFNIDLRDDKRYPYLRVTLEEPFPRLLVARRTTVKTSAYFGPYTDAQAMRQVMAFARRIFGIRTCSKKLPLPRPVRPCINYEMGRCSGACANKISQEQYRENIAQLQRFLKGRRADLVKELREKMALAATRFSFEEAAAIRDQIALIEDASRLQRVDLSVNDMDCDVFGMFDNGRSIGLTVLGFREGLLLQRRNFLVSHQRWACAEGDRESALLLYYENTPGDPPGEILLGESIGANPDIIEQWFLEHRSQRVKVSVPQRGLKMQLVAMAEKNARFHAGATLPDDAQLDLDDLKTACNLERTPRTIEAFDISNLGESFAVAGMVRFTDGRPDKAQYRRYKIKTVEGQNDFAMMMEAVTRRLTRLHSENTPFPDLLLIDGGKGQLGAALKALDAFESPPMIISLAKQEELIFSPSSPDPIALPPAHPARKLVQRIRDEVHRWAITYHRSIRGKQFRKSSLELIPGVGPRTASLLLKKFGSLNRLREISIEQMAALPGVSKRAAGNVREFLDKKKADHDTKS